MENNIVVSICCLAYNHGKYIRQTIDSILMQKTTFQYEILINDDASTDDTTSIIQEYECRYPECIRGIYHKENQYAKGEVVFLEGFKLSRGEYILTCECDDYWTDPYKLQTQFEIMEHNPNVSLCTHLVRHVWEDGSRKDIIQPPDLHEGIIEGEEFIKMMLSRNDQSIFHYSSYCFRKSQMVELVDKTPEFITKAPVGDIFLQLYSGCYGDVYLIEREMSDYRRNSVGSWTLLHRQIEKKIKMITELISSYQSFNAYTDYKYSVLIDEYIKGLQFQISLAENDFKSVVSDKKRFKNISLLKKIRVFLCCYLPYAERMYLYIKSKKGW